MLEDADKFTGYSSLKEPNWPRQKREDSMVPKERNRDFGVAFGSGLGSGSGFGSVATAHTRIARVLADALRNQKNGAAPVMF